MCVNCIRGQVDITDGIPKQLIVQWCKSCARYLNPPTQWILAEFESKELLSVCLKRIRGLNKVKLIDAGFIWTEPHSRRLKVKLTIQKEVLNSTILQQSFVIEYVVQSMMCDTCHRNEAKDTWNAVVQLRQRVPHKRTFYFLEQLIIKHNAQQHTTNIKESPDGLDFFFVQRSHAQKFCEFLNAVVPIRYKTSEKLISADLNNNVYNYKYTFSVEITPVCKDDLVCLPPKLAHACGNISPILLCLKVASILHFLDPLTLQRLDLSATQFYTYPFKAIMNSRQLTEYIVLDISPTNVAVGKFLLSDIQVARSRDLGNNDVTFIGRTHLGHLLKAGDTVLGYDVAAAVVNESEFESVKERQIPEFVLVKKSYPEYKRKRNRIWKLKELDKEQGEDMKKHEIKQAERDREEFLTEIEEDVDLRTQINLYKVKNAKKILAQRKKEKEEQMDDDGEDAPDVGLEELLEELTIDDKSVSSEAPPTL